jgi:hypothetical protein
MTLSSQAALGGLFCLIGSTSSYCAGTGSATLTTPLGDWGIGYTWEKENESVIDVNTTLPPGVPASTLVIEGRPIQLPANPTGTPWPMEIQVRDPIILQIPIGWSIASATITTPLGTGNVIVQPDNVPSRIEIQSDGSATYHDFFVPEPGYQIWFCDCPAPLVSTGMISGTLHLVVPLSERRVDVVKVIETWRAIGGLPGGPTYTCYLPVGPYTHDFANVGDLAHAFVVDASALPCTGPSGATPRALPSGLDWNIGTTTAVRAEAMDPNDLSVLLVGGHELTTPLPIGGLGCKLLINFFDAVWLPVGSNGSASVPVAVPADPGLVGAVLTWQPAQLHAATADVVLGSYLKTVIEP